MVARRLKGFTLIELLAVIAIIGILSALAAISVSNATKRARDAQRQRDLSNLKTALELYNQDKGQYPSPSTWTTDLAPTYIQTVPNDPKSNGTTGGWQYSYTTDTSGNYLLEAGLEYQSGTVGNNMPTCSAPVSSKGNGVADGSSGGLLAGTGTANGATKRCFRLTND